MSNYDIVQLCNDAVGMAHMQNSTLHTHFISNIDEYIIHTAQTGSCNSLSVF